MDWPSGYASTKSSQRFSLTDRIGATSARTLNDAWDRYLAAPPLSDGSVTNVTSVTSVTSVQPLDVTDVTLVAANGGELDPDDWSFNTEPQEVKASMAASDKRD